MDYKEAGVDIGLANSILRKFKHTINSGGLNTMRGFCALNDLDLKSYVHPIIATSADGVGTKSRLASKLGRHKTIGQDLVAMCVNDIVTSGATPKLFLDCISFTSFGNPQVIPTIISNISKVCESEGMILSGGELAQMPSVYRRGEYDLTGFAVGVVEKDDILDGRNIVSGDLVIGIESSGLHSNGYSIVNKILDDADAIIPIPTDKLLEPTIIYAKAILGVRGLIKAAAHITGGGIKENLSRVLPEKLKAYITVPELAKNPGSIFNWVQIHGRVSNADMLNTFNCGFGMCVVTSKEKGQEVIDTLLHIYNLEAKILGCIEPSDNVEVQFERA